MSEINPATVELDGVHAVAHITRKVKRDEFPFATYVFVADQLNLPTGLTTATLTGQIEQRCVVRHSQKDVLNIPDSARAFGVLKQKMGNISFYKATRQDRGPASRQRDLGLEHSGDARVQKRRSTRHRQGQGELHASPGGGGRTTADAAEKVRGPPGRRHRPDRPATHEQTKIPARLRHSIQDLAS